MRCTHNKATEIDKRVVEMQFNNKDFEKNCQASLTTLEKLKMALNFDGAKGLESMGKAASKLDLGNIAKGAEAVEVKFNAMNIAGMTVVSELTKGFLNLGKTIWNVSFGQMKSGGMARTLKIDQAKFQMKALAENLDQVKQGAMTVQQVMDGMLDAVDRSVTGTAYGYDAAAAVASQLMASGLTDTDKMYNHLRAIAGAAAMTGRSFEDIGNIFTTVASNGRLMTMQLRQFSASGLNLSATLAQQLNKTEDEINAMVTKGLIDFDTFSDALFESFGEAAGKADETWSGVTSNVRAQLSRIGQLFTDPFVKHMIPVFASLKAAIKQVNTVLKPLSKTFDMIMGNVANKLKNTLDNLNVASLRIVVNGIENILAGLIMTIDTLRKAFLTVFPPKTLDDVRNAAIQFEYMSRQLIPTQETLDGLKQVFMALLTPLKLAFNIIKSLSNKVMKPLLLAVSRLLAAFLRLGNALEPFIEVMVKTVTEGTFLNDVFMIFAATAIVVVDAISNIVQAFGILFGEVIDTTLVKSLIELFKELSRILANVVLVALKTVFQVINAIMSVINVDNIINVMHAVGGAFSLLINIILLGMTTIVDVIRNIMNSGTVIGNVFKTIKELVGLVSDLFSGKDISERLGNIKTLLDAIKEGVKDLFSTIRDQMKNINASKLMLLGFGFAMIFLVWSIKNLTDAMTGFVKTASSTFGIFGSIKKAIQNIGKMSPTFQALIGITVAIGMITAALVTLSNDTDPERLKTSAIVLGTFAAGLIALAIGVQFVQSKLGNSSEGIKSLIAMMAGLAGSVLILAIAMKTISKLEVDLSQIWKPMLVIIGFIAAISAAMIAMNRWSGDTNMLAREAIVLLGFAISIKILAGVLKSLAEVDLVENAKNTILGLIGIMGLMVTLAGSMALMGVAGIGAGAGFAAQGFVISLLGVVLLLKVLAAQPYEVIEAGLKRMKLMFVPIVEFLAIAGIITKVAGGAFFGGLGGAIMAINAAIILLTGTVALLGSMDMTTLIQGMIFTALIGAVLKSLIKNVVTTLDKTKEFNVIDGLNVLHKFLLGLGASMILLSIAIKIMDGVNLDTVILAGFILGELGYIMYKILDVSKNTEKAKVAPIIAIITAISSIMAAMAILSFQDPRNILATGVAIGVALGGLAAVLKFVNEKPVKELGKEEKAKDTDKAKNSTALIAAALGGIILSLAALAHFATKVQPGQMEALKILLGAMAGVFVIMAIFIAVAGRIQNASFGENAKNIAIIIGIVCGAMILMAGAIAGLAVISNSFGWGNVLAAGGAVALAVVGIVAAMDKIQKIEHNAKDGKKSLMKFAQSFVIMCSGLTIIAAALAGLSVITSQVSNFGHLMGSVLAISLLAGVVVAAMFGMMYIDTNIRGHKDVKGGKNQSVNKFVGKGTMNQIATSLVIACTAFAVIAAALAGLSSAISNTSSFGMLMGSVLALSILTGIMFVGMNWIIDSSKNLDKSRLNFISTSFVIMAAMYAVIGAALVGLSAAMGLIGFGAVMGSVLAIGSLAVVMFAGMFAIIKASEKVSADKIKELRGVFMWFGVMVVLITASIAMLGNLDAKDEKTFRRSIDALMKIVNSITAFLGILVLVAALYDGVMKFTGKEGGLKTELFYAVATNFVAMGAAVTAIAIGLSGLIAVMRDVEQKKVEKACNTLLIIFGIMAGMTVAVGVLSALPGIGEVIKGAILAMLGFAGAVSVFSAAALMIANTLKTLVETILLFNQTQIDSESIKDNAKEVAAALPDILKTIKDLLVGFGEGLAVAGMAWVTGILKGFDQSLPDILETVKSIMQKIGAFLQSEENQKIIHDFAYSMGETIYTVVGGFFEGLLKLPNDGLDGFMDRFMEWKTEKAIMENTTDVRRKQVQDKIMDKYGLGYAGFSTDALSNELYDSKGKIQNIYNLLDDGDKRLAARLADSRRLNRAENEALFNDILAQMKMELALKEKTGNTTEDIVDAFEGLAKVSGLSAEFTSRLEFEANKAKYTFDALGNVIEDTTVKTEDLASSGMSQTKQTLTKDAEELADAVDENGNKIVDSVTDTTEKSKEVAIGGFDSIINAGKSLFSGEGGLINAIGSVVNPEELKTLFGKVMSAAGEAGGKEFNISVLDNIDFPSIFNKLKAGEIDESVIMNILAGKEGAIAYEKSYEETLEKYRKEGLKKVTNRNGQQVSAWEAVMKQDKEGNWYQVYKNVDEYALARMDEETELISGANKALQEYGFTMEDVTDSTDGLADSTNGLSDSLGGVDKSLLKAANKFKDFYNSLHDSMENALKNIYDEYKEFDPINPEEMLKRMEANTKQIGKWARQLQELAAKGMSEGLLNELKDMGPQAADKVDAFARMTSDQLERANQMFAAKTKLPDYATDNIVESYENAGFMASLGFANGVDSAKAKEMFFKLGEEGLAELEKSLDEHSPSKETEKRGIWAVQGFDNGLTNPAILLKIRLDIQRLAKSITDIFEKSLNINRMRQVALYMIDGLVAGLKAGEIKARLTASTVASSIFSAFTSRFKINSPSKVMAELGGYIMQGLGLGMEDGTSYVERATGQSADDILAMMRESLIGKLDNIGEDGVYQPVIRPVLDMSEVQNGYLAFQNYLSTAGIMAGGIDLSGNLARLTPTTRDEGTDQTQYDILEAIRGIDVDGIRTEIGNLRTDISELQQAVTNMQVVMDTGALVGQIVDPMDNALGSKALVNGRGRY